MEPVTRISVRCLIPAPVSTEAIAYFATFLVSIPLIGIVGPWLAGIVR